MTKRRKILIGLLTLIVTGLMMYAPVAMAQQLSLNLGNDDGTLSGRVVQMLALLTILSIAPGLLIMMTSFIRIIVVCFYFNDNNIFSKL